MDCELEKPANWTPFFYRNFRSRRTRQDAPVPPPKQTNHPVGMKIVPQTLREPLSGKLKRDLVMKVMESKIEGAQEIYQLVQAYGDARAEEIQIQNGYSTDSGKILGALVRDITSLGWRSRTKSEMKRRLLEYGSQCFKEGGGTLYAEPPVTPAEKVEEKKDDSCNCPPYSYCPKCV